MNMERNTFVAASHPEAEERTLTTTTHTPAVAERRTYPCDEELRLRLLRFRDEALMPNGEHWTNTSIAQAIRRNKAIISQYLSPGGNLYESIALHERRIAEFLRDQRTIFDTRVETISNEISDKVFHAIEDARVARRMVVVIGEPGIGKSRGIGHYCLTHDLAIVFRAWAGQCTKAHVVDLLWEAAKVARGVRGENRLRLLADRLADSGNVIVADDAHKLSAQALQTIYDLRDQAGLGVVLLGDHRLRGKLLSDGQRMSRTEDVIELVVSAPGATIKHHLAQLLPDIDAEDLVEVLPICKRIVDGPGHFRSLQLDLAYAARTLRLKPDGVSAAEAIDHAHRKMLRQETKAKTNRRQEMN